MSGQKSNSITTRRGSLGIEINAPEYHSVERRIHVEQPMRLTIRLYPRRLLQQPAALPTFYTQPAWQPEPVFQPVPTLIVGLGGTGRHVLTHIKKNLLDVGFGKMPAQVRLALLDTPAQDQIVSVGDVSLTAEEIVELSADLKPLLERLRQHSDPDLSGWFPAEEYAQRLSDDELNLAYGTRQRRPLSRAMLIEDLRQGIFDEGIDILLILDCSASMGEVFQAGEERLTKLQAAKQAALSFLSQIDHLADRVGVIAFAEDAQEVAPLSNHFEQTIQAVQSISLRDETDIHHALQRAEDIFTHSNAGERPKVIILLSDGESDVQSATASAEQLRQKGIHLVCIGIGNANRALLERLASSWQEQPDAFYAADAQTLGQIYLRLARRMGQGSRVWRLLRSMASSVIDNDSLRVILVASLAGGFGSAVLADIAYLARRVGQAMGAKSISIEAYLADAAIFSRVAAPRYETLQANAFAAAREIERFQLAQGFPFKMVYDSQSGEHPVLNGSLNWRLLDNLYLFDHLPASGTDGPAQERWFDPAFSVFPMMADAICFALDNNSRTGPLRDYRRNLQGTMTSEQWARGRAVVGSMGVFRYLFPMHDLFEIFKARWAVRLLSQLLTGQPDPTTPLRAEQNLEESISQIDQHVRLFLLGYAGYEQVPCPEALKTVGRVLLEGRNILEDVKAEQGTDLAAASQMFGAYLRSALQVMLNGLSSSIWQKARAGKAGYVLAFLSRLEEDLEDAGSIFINTDLEKFTEACLNETRQTHQRLLQLLGRLNSALVDEKHRSPKPSLLHHLQAREQFLMARLHAQQDISTRKLVLEQSEIDAFLNDALTAPQPVEEGLSHFYWDENSQDGFALTLQAWKQIRLTTDADLLQPFIEELLHLAAQAGKILFEKESLPDWLKRKLTTISQREDMALQAWAASQPLLRFTPQKAAQARPALTLAARERLDWLADSLVKRLPTEQQFLPVQVADPYSLLILQTIDVVPGDALESWNENRQVYNRWYGLTETGQRDPYAEPTAVFHAESVSLRWEARLPQLLRQTPRLFVPLLVTALESSPRARLFALAFASGWMQVRERILSILPPGLPPVQVELPDLSNFSRRPSPYVTGMVYFEQQATLEQIQTIEQALQTVNLDFWRRWTTPDWNRNDWAAAVLATDSPDAADFVAYTAMLVRNEFLKRSQNRS